MKLNFFVDYKPVKVSDFRYVKPIFIASSLHIYLIIIPLSRRLNSIFLLIAAPEWAIVFLGIVGIAIVLCCAYLVIRKLFGKKRHGEKNKQKGPGGMAGGFKNFFKPGGADADFSFAPNKVLRLCVAVITSNHLTLQFIIIFAIAYCSVSICG